MCIWPLNNYELFQDNPSIDLNPNNSKESNSAREHDLPRVLPRLSRLLFVDTADISSNSRRLFTGQQLPGKVVPANTDVKIILILEYNIVFAFSAIFRPSSFREHCNWNHLFYIKNHTKSPIQELL